MADSSDSSMSKIPFFVSLASGAAAGVCVDVSLYPIDTVKTRLQSPEGFWRAGGFRGVYRGLSVASLGAAPGAALFFCSYDSSKYYLKQSAGHWAPNGMIHLAASSVGELVACLVRVPTEVIKQKMQTRFSGSSMLHVGRVIFASEGYMGFYSGFSVTLMREIPFAAIQFPIYEQLKIMAARGGPSDGPDSGGVSSGAAATCGSIAGSIAAAATTPLDVAKTRIMIGTDVEGRKYSGLVDTLSRVYGSGGIRSVFSGIQPRVTWISIGGFVFFGAYEFTKNNLLCL